MEGFRDVLVWGGLLMLAVLALGALLLTARWWHLRLMRQGPAEPFSMKTLDRMRSAGQLSAEEHSRLRRAALGLGVAQEKGKSLSSSPTKLDDGRDAREEKFPRQDEECV